MFGKTLFTAVLWFSMTVPVAAEKDDNLMLTNRKSWLHRHGLTKEWRQKEKPPAIYSAQGQQYKKVRGNHAEPKLVVDTLRFSGEGKALSLNRFPRGRRESVSATAANKLHLLSIQGITVDSTKLNRTFDSLTIYTTDTALAEVVLMVQ
jgi:hypothetical protein